MTHAVTMEHVDTDATLTTDTEDQDKLTEESVIPDPRICKCESA